MKDPRAGRPVLLLSRSDVAKALSIEELIDPVAEAHRRLALGLACQPPRQTVQVPGSDAEVFPMAAALDPRTGGLKVFTDVPGNAERGLPVQQSVVLLLDLETGQCVAILDGGILTAYRTAAASAVATKQLARVDSRVLGLIGTGAQARAHLVAIRAVRPIERVVVWGRTAERAEEFARNTSGEGVEVEVCATPAEVARSADVLCTLTPAKSPILLGAWLQPGVHLNVVGAPPRLDHREVDTEAVCRSRVVVDSRDAVRLESGDLMIPVGEGAIGLSHFEDEIGEVIAGTKPGRTNDDQITMYKSVGVAVQDVVAAQAAVDNATRLGLGTPFSIRS